MIERQICTENNRYDPDDMFDRKKWSHTDSVQTGEWEDIQYGIVYVDYTCPHCKLEFSVELPQ